MEKMENYGLTGGYCPRAGFLIVISRNQNENFRGAYGIFESICPTTSLTHWKLSSLPHVILEGQ